MLFSAAYTAPLQGLRTQSNTSPYACQRLLQHINRYSLKSAPYTLTLIQHLDAGAVYFVNAPSLIRNNALRAGNAPLLLVPFGTEGLADAHDAGTFAKEKLAIPSVDPKTFIQVGDKCYMSAIKFMATP